MNRSGTAVRAMLDSFGIEPAKCLVVYDDMDLPFGALRLRERGSPGTHNGMRSVVATLNTDAVPRLRIGISQAAPGEATSHVLSEFAPDERQAVEDLVARAADAALAWAIQWSSRSDEPLQQNVNTCGCIHFSPPRRSAGIPRVWSKHCAHPAGVPRKFCR